MSNRNARAGRTWTNAVVGVAQEEALLTAEVRALHGAKDRGDVAGVEDVTVECKNEKAIELAAAVDEAALEAVHAGTRYFVAAIKRRRKPARHGYAVTTVGNYFALVCELLSLRARVAQLESIVRALGGSPDGEAVRVERGG